MLVWYKCVEWSVVGARVVKSAKSHKSHAQKTQGIYKSDP